MALVAAINKASLDAMREALRSGADATHFVVDEETGYRWSLGRQVLQVRLAKHDDAGDAWRVAALRLLHDHGALRPGLELNETFVEAVQYCPGPAVARFLLDCGAEVDYYSAGLMTTALDACDCVDTARVLIAAGAYVNDALVYHAYYTRDEMVRVLLDAGAADVNTGSCRGWTPLIAAAEGARDIMVSFGGTIDMMRRLLQAGADPTVKDVGGSLPLFWAVNASFQHGVGQQAQHREWRAIIRLLIHAEAWWNRRHLLLAIRGRYSGAATAERDE